LSLLFTTLPNLVAQEAKTSAQKIIPDQNFIKAGKDSLFRQ